MTARAILLDKSSSGYLVPYDAASADYLAAWPVGKVLEARVRYMRSPEHHRFTMALVAKLYEAGVIEAQSMDAAIDIAKHVAGFVEPLRLPNGYTYARARSISYAAADEQTYRNEFAEPLRTWAAQTLDMDDAAMAAEFGELI